MPRRDVPYPVNAGEWASQVYGPSQVWTNSLRAFVRVR